MAVLLTLRALALAAPVVAAFVLVTAIAAGGVEDLRWRTALGAAHLPRAAAAPALAARRLPGVTQEEAAPAVVGEFRRGRQRSSSPAASPSASPTTRARAPPPRRLVLRRVERPRACATCAARSASSPRTSSASIRRASSRRWSSRPIRRASPTGRGVPASSRPRRCRRWSAGSIRSPARAAPCRCTSRAASAPRVRSRVPSSASSATAASISAPRSASRCSRSSTASSSASSATRRAAPDAGRFIRIGHKDGTVVSRYIHLDSIRDDLREGAHVHGGELIGRLGRTGVEHSGAHLHFALSLRPSGRGGRRDTTSIPSRCCATGRCPSLPAIAMNATTPRSSGGQTYLWSCRLSRAGSLSRSIHVTRSLRRRPGRTPATTSTWQRASSRFSRMSSRAHS